MTADHIFALVVIAWIVASLFVAGVAGRSRGIGAFFLWLLGALLFSPLFALLGLAVVMLRRQVDRLEEIREELRRAPLRQDLEPGRFSELAGE
jgi:uncharacterized membrane protein YGL010W